MKHYKLPSIWIETSKTKIAKVSRKATLKFYLDFITYIAKHTPNDYGYVEVNKNILEKMNVRYAKILAVLGEAELIKINHSYSNGKNSFCKGYRINDIDSLLEDVAIINMDYAIQKAEDEVYQASIDCIKKIKVDWDAYEVIRDEVGQSTIMECVTYRYLVDIHNNNYKWSIGKNVDRLFTPVTGIKKEFRKCLLIDREPVTEIDIVNCIPQMLGIFIKHHNEFVLLYKDYLTPSFDITQYNLTEGFEKDVHGGIVYEKLAEITNLTRKETKLAVMWLLFAKNCSPQENVEVRNAVKKAFIELYPSTWRLICDLKKKEFGTQEKDNSYHVNFSRLMFRFETYFMFCIFGKELISNDIKFTTIHDSFMVKVSDEMRVRELMWRALQDAHGIEVKI